MGLANASIKSGATWAPTGGTDLAFIPDGRSVPNGVSLVVSTDTNLITRRQLVCRATLPGMPGSANAYARLGRNTAVYRVPFIASDGKLYIQTTKLETAFHAEYPAEDKNATLSEMIAIAADSDFVDFWASSILS